MRRGLRRALASAVVSCLLACFSQPVPAAGMGEEQIVFRRHDNSLMKIALTFDDGPHEQHTEKILEILRRYGVPATFFVVGSNAEAYPELIAEILADGHEIGNHTYSHCNLSNGEKQQIAEELSRTEDVLQAISDYRPKLLRPPGGAMNSRLRRLAREMDYTVILWSVDTRDWAHTRTDKILETIRKNLQSGDIILFHDYVSGVSHTEEALETILPELLDAGYRFVTVSELLESS